LLLGGLFISTVWLGLEHPGGFFETMTFLEKDGGPEFGHEELCIRYWSLEEASEGHKELVEKLREERTKEEIKDMVI
jgi:hypothetical protein